MQVTATAKYVRVSPQKVRLVVDQIKKMPPTKAIEMLAFIDKSASSALKKVILSAIANAKNNHNLKEETLLFKKIEVGNGPVSKRYQPISRGRAHPILKRTSHIMIVIDGQQGKEVKKLNQQVQDNSKKLQEKKLISNKEESKNGTKS